MGVRVALEVLLFGGRLNPDNSDTDANKSDSSH